MLEISAMTFCLQCRCSTHELWYSFGHCTWHCQLAPSYNALLNTPSFIGCVELHRHKYASLHSKEGIKHINLSNYVINI